MNAESITVESRAHLTEVKDECGLTKEMHSSKHLAQVKLRIWMMFNPAFVEAVNINGQWFIPVAKDSEDAVRFDFQWDSMKGNSE